jgi:hypothetical protein
MRRLCWLLAIGALACLGAWAGRLWLESLAGDAPYAAIEDDLYVGAAVRQPPLGTEAVVNLCTQKDRYQVDHALWAPFDGGQTLSLDELRRIVDFIAEQRRAGRRTYVHCLAGMNRSGMVITAYLMAEHGWGRDRALAFARSKRPQLQPNPPLMRLLHEWERALADGSATRNLNGQTETK